MDDKDWKRHGELMTEHVVPIIIMIRLGLLETSQFTHLKGWVKYNTIIGSMAQTLSNYDDVKAIVREMEAISIVLEAEKEAFLKVQTQKWWDEY